MSILPDWQIYNLATWTNMIHPFFNYGSQPQVGKISKGVSSYGYDLTLDHKFLKGVKRPPNEVLDPKNPDPKFYESIIIPQGETYALESDGFLLGVSQEELHIPRDMIALCVGKSTYERAGIHVNITPIEPGWKGFLTVEIHNQHPSTVLLYPSEGIAQLLFFRTDGKPCEVDYAEKRGKYQNQANQPTLPKAS